MNQVSVSLADVPVCRLARPLRDGRTASIGYRVIGEGPLIVCVPGMGELAAAYRFTVPALVAAGFRVAVMDLRGHGDSDADFDSYDDVATGTDLLALVEHLAPAGGSAVLMGTSMGAGAATWAAAERPELVAGLVLIGAFVRNPPMNPVLVGAFRLLMGGPWATRVWGAYLPKLYPGHRPSDFEEHRRAVVASMRRPGYRRAFTRTTRTTHAPVEARLAEVKAPVLVVMGTQDPDFADPVGEASWIAERLSGDVVRVEGAGHYPQVQEPELVNAAVVAFCRRAVGA
ncbi:MAG: alpha/beta fold hydrolase [Actinomycetales bacterium]